VPFNAFGGRGTITPEMLAYTTFTEHDVSQQTLVDAVANLSGNLVKLPAGWLAAAVGIEHRRLNAFYEPDAVVAAGDSADIPATPTHGSYTVNEAYAELRAPVLSRDARRAAARPQRSGFACRNYSFLDAELTGKIGARWKPTSDLIFRGSYARGFRAPSLGELFRQQVAVRRSGERPLQRLPTATTTMDPRLPRSRRAASPSGSPPMVATRSPIRRSRSLPTATQGPKPEKSNSFNISAAYSPEQLQGRPGIDSLDFELAYWDIPDHRSDHRARTPSVSSIAACSATTISTARTSRATVPVQSRPGPTRS